MTGTMKLALVALSLAGGSLAVVAPANADSTSTTITTTTVDPGVVAFGYNDGYWDRSRAWHAWPSHGAAVQYETRYHDHYYGWKHDRDPDKGWREHDSWWNAKTPLVTRAGVSGAGPQFLSPNSQ